MPPSAECLMVVTGLPRSGTAMLMQMLAAGGVPVLTDGVREPDEHNPRGYFEFEQVKSILRDSKWLMNARGKAVKIVAPLLSALPCDLPCRVILIERNLDEVLDSQDRMLARVLPPDRRAILKSEYVRTLERSRRMLSERLNARLLVLNHRETLCDPFHAAQEIRQFLECDLDVISMAAAVDPALHRNRAPV